MSIQVRVSLILRQFTSNRELVDVACRTPIECVKNFVKKFPDSRQWLYDEAGELQPQVWLFLNGQEVFPDELNKPLNDGDELFILLAIGGG